jgi:hypothetical protein
MSQFGQSRKNVFYMACAKRSARAGQRNPVSDRLDSALPPGNPKRWTPRLKTSVILAVRKKVINVWDACERYDLSAAELAEWERDLDRFGIVGLRATKILYRKTSSK